MANEFTTAENSTLDDLRAGGNSACAKFFNDRREELQRMTRFRIDRRLKRRMDDSDILQEAYLEYCNRIKSYLETPQIPPLIWLRRLVRQVISRQNRDHIGTQCRDLRREKYDLSSSAVNIEHLAVSLSSVGSKLNRLELRARLFDIVQSMSPIEREILTLVHFEEMTIREAALELEIGFEAAKKRYRRALNRLRKLHEEELQTFRDSL